MKLPRMFIGWTNIRFVIKELVKMYSSGTSFFSKKRIESGIAFIAFQHGAIWYLHNKIATMDTYDFLMWASSELLICGYTLNAIEKAKQPKKPNDGNPAE